MTKADKERLIELGFGHNLEWARREPSNRVWDHPNTNAAYGRMARVVWYEDPETDGRGYRWVLIDWRRKGMSLLVRAHTLEDLIVKWITALLET